MRYAEEEPWPPALLEGGGDPRRRRLRFELCRKWTPRMRAALRRLEPEPEPGDGGIEAIFSMDDGIILSITFPSQYPFKSFVPCVVERVVEHSLEVMRALCPRLPRALLAAVRRHLAVRRRTPLKQWAYYRLYDIEEYTRTMPPHHWSPCMDLAQQWDAITRILRTCSHNRAAPG